MDFLQDISHPRPENVEGGEAARLFPVLEEKSRERRAASVLLATLSIVDPLADALFRRLGRPIGKRASIRCFTEVVFKSDPALRPDGLVMIDSGRDTWSALVECKIGKSKIDVEQLEKYIRQARDNAINCVVTISNELVADPSRPSTTVSGKLKRSVAHFHYSWLAIRSEAEILYRQRLVTDPEKNFILAELIRFLSHPSAGVEGFNQMPAVWPELLADVVAGLTPRKTDPRVLEIADAWLQEEKELALILSRLVSRRCVARSERKLKREGYDPFDEILTELADKQLLVTSFDVPDAAADIVLRADLRSRSTRISMTLRAPEDRKRPEARLNWLLNQLKAADAEGIEIVAHWRGSAKPTSESLAILRDDPKRVAENARPGMTPYAFEVVQNCHTPAAFAGRRRFIQDMETTIQEFYTNVGRHLSPWQPKAPPPSSKTAAAEIEEGATLDKDRLASVEQSLSAVLQSLMSPSAPAPSDTASHPPAPTGDAATTSEADNESDQDSGG